MNIICIYPHDTTTDFLHPIYEELSRLDNFIGLRFDTNIIENLNKIKDVISNTPDGSFVIFLGHGSSYCLYGTPNNSEKTMLINKDEINKLNNCSLLVLACRSSELISETNFHIGFGDIPTDFNDINAIRNMEDASYLHGISENDIDILQQILVRVIAKAINYTSCADITFLHKIVKLQFNKHINHLLKSPRQNRQLADLLIEIKNEMVVRSYR